MSPWYGSSVRHILRAITGSMAASMAGNLDPDAALSTRRRYSASDVSNR